MGSLANISGKRARKAFLRLGYVMDRQKGSHMILVHDSRPTLSLPNHKELAPVCCVGLSAKADFRLRNFYPNCEPSAAF